MNKFQKRLNKLASVCVASVSLMNNANITLSNMIYKKIPNTLIHLGDKEISFFVLNHCLD
jgi:hypothetical protein